MQPLSGMPTIGPGASTCGQSVDEKKKKAVRNPLQNGIRSYLIKSWSASENSPAASEQALPKRFTLYSPLLLLPVNFPSHTPVWHDAYSQLDASRRADLFGTIAQAFIRSGQYVTHIAINAPIPSLETAEATSLEQENVLRRPRDLVPVHGNFGPSCLLDALAIGPSQDDFDAAFWVTTKQSPSVSQVWAPRWTMFSRGNVTEKNRILGENSNSPFYGLNESELGQTTGEIDVLDMYVGIGYFAFSYLARGVKRVWGWDLNPWSIEGLRRGCEVNGWRCLLVRVAEDGSMDGMSVESLARSIIESERGREDELVRCVAFCGDNKWSAQLLGALDNAMREHEQSHTELIVRHVNLGLLPTSTRSWGNAVVGIDAQRGGWLHVHENVNTQCVHAKSQEITQKLGGLLASHKVGRWRVHCEHVERVKPYGPGVVHGVFDMFIQPQLD